MDTLLGVGLGNAVAATVLAVAVAVVARCCRRPALAHSLWLLVLLKLVTPPLWRVPVPDFSPIVAPGAGQGAVAPAGPPVREAPLPTVPQPPPDITRDVPGLAAGV